MYFHSWRQYVYILLTVMTVREWESFYWRLVFRCYDVLEQNKSALLQILFSWKEPLIILRKWWNKHFNDLRTKREKNLLIITNYFTITEPAIIYDETRINMKNQTYFHVPTMHDIKPGFDKKCQQKMKCSGLKVLVFSSEILETL